MKNKNQTTFDSLPLRVAVSLASRALSFCARGALWTAFLVLLAGPLRAADRQRLQGHVPAAVPRLQTVERLPDTQRLNLAIGLPLRKQTALTTLLQQLYDPASPSYHQWLTPEQFADKFGPTKADYEAVIGWAKAHGLNVTATHPNRMVLDVEGAVVDIEAAFHLTMRVYQHPREARTFHAPDTEPSLDLAVPILHVSGLDNFALPRPHLKTRSRDQAAKPDPNAGSGPGGTYMANDFRAAYVPDTTLTGAGQAVGLLQFDGYATSDIAYYIATNHLSSVTLSNVLLDGFDGSRPAPAAKLRCVWTSKWSFRWPRGFRPSTSMRRGLMGFGMIFSTAWPMTTWPSNSVVHGTSPAARWTQSPTRYFSRWPHRANPFSMLLVMMTPIVD